MTVSVGVDEREREDRREAPREASRGGRLGPLEVLELGPTLARMGALASLRATRWATSSTLAGWRRLGVALRERESPAELMSSAQAEALRQAREALGVTELEQTLARLTSEESEAAASDGPAAASALRERGRELLGRSAKLEPEPDAHPAFGLLLEQVAPDEARILRVLAEQGPQPVVDVVQGGPLGVGDGRHVGSRLSVLGEVAGCREAERIQLYLDNLLRLGLVRLNDDPLDEEPLYDLLEAQPEVSEAKEEASAGARRAKVVRRRIELSELGGRFRESCLPTEDG
jgi:hypothetical protein